MGYINFIIPICSYMTIFLKNIKTTSATICDEYPFNIPAYSQGINIEIKSPVLILV